MILYTIASPAGPITLTAAQGVITGLSFGGSPSAAPPPTPLLQQAADQLQEYFSGCRRTFPLPLSPAGTPFQHEVWSALRKIPYGTTCSYGQIAAAIGRPKAVRAVAQAIGHNPIAIIIPCHRVIGKDGSLTGYAWGLTIKELLLSLERS